MSLNTIKSQKQEALYFCPICKLKYIENKWAKACEKWCKEYNSCNLEITKYSLKNVK